MAYDSSNKLALIEGAYRFPGTKPKHEASEYALNGGFDASWWNLNNEEANFPYTILIDRFTFSGDEDPGFFQGARKRCEVVMTIDAITWNFIGTGVD